MDRWLCAFLLGYALSFFFSAGADVWLYLPGAGLALCCFLLSYFQHIRTHLIGCVLCGILWGTGNAYFVQRTLISDQWTQTTMTTVMQVTSVSHHHPGLWRITGVLTKLDEQSLLSRPIARLQWYQAHAQAPQRLPRQGETWQFSVRLRHPQGTRNEGGMRYHRYLLGQGVNALGSIRSGQYLSGAVSWRQNLVSAVEAALGKVELKGPLLALLVGERYQMSDADWTLVQRTGLAHLIAISGLHLSLVAGFALALTWHAFGLLVRRRSRRDQLNLWAYTPWLALVLAMAYAALSGFAITTLRAALMLGVVVLHKQLGWRVSAPRILLRAVVVVILVEPLAPLTTGFWLSVMAVAAIVFMNWRWQRYQGRWSRFREWWRFEWLITILFWPLMALWFGGVSLAAALINILVVPLVSFWVLPVGLLGVMAAGLGALAAAEQLFVLAAWPLQQLWPQLGWLAEQPWQWLSAADLPAWSWLLSFTLILLLPIRWLQRGVAVAVLVMCQLVYEAIPERRQLFLHVLDVGQGSALVLQRQQQALLIDTGASWDGSVAMAERVIMPFLESKRLRPELAFITHTDRDHQGGYTALQQRFPAVRWLGGASTTPCVAGQSGSWREVQWQVLHPTQESGIGNQSNNSSCVVLLQFDNVRILVTGDIEKTAERQLLARLAPVSAEILVVPHHGSKSSSEDYFIRHVQPSLALVSRGRNNPYGQAHPEVVARYAGHRITMLDTARGGQITLWTDGRRWQAWQPLAQHFGSWFDVDPHDPSAR
ncbi:DNA internalization-related competence protein ComEC/Rec2 [Pseudidiomarina sp. 1ASP75-14]|uniref:DNA internalization-related competence protein ComEC/Rec2 n=1 Tax=Pseudidiomarina terrestris TaxID=2820060 RepID=UPI002653166C|nr:DNA internalization-related competence protein ComEC/Rec2 [Pseudidiomarina sp. 1ASP75-14]MDN7138500.1 DNA internalization-related competence protein ComEC/Rec2 [Pseudidiomarina sp. 1ASP75-14]